MSYYPHDDDDGAGPAIAMILLGVWILLMFAGCGGTMRPLTPEEQKTFEARVWADGMGRRDPMPAVWWRSDVGRCDNDDRTFLAAPGMCVLGAYWANYDRIHISEAAPEMICHEFAHAVMWREHEAEYGALPDHVVFDRQHRDARFLRKIALCRNVADKLLAEIGAAP